MTALGSDPPDAETLKATAQRPPFKVPTGVSSASGQHKAVASALVDADVRQHTLSLAGSFDRLSESNLSLVESNGRLQKAVVGTMVFVLVNTLLMTVHLLTHW